jgi:hypothetical protein
MFYLVPPVSTLTVDPFQPALALQNDAGFPVAPRLRIWCSRELVFVVLAGRHRGDLVALGDVRAPLCLAAVGEEMAHHHGQPGVVVGHPVLPAATRPPSVVMSPLASTSARI